MYKRSERHQKEDQKLKKIIKRNWIIGIVSLILAFFCYFFFDDLYAAIRS